MPRKVGPQINGLVVLPARELMGIEELTEELRITRMTLKNWKDRYGFPDHAFQDGWYRFFRVAEIAFWLRKYGANVRIV